MRLPRQFFASLATGAPAPLRELPVRLERMIHFVPPHNEKLRAKVPELVRQVDVVLGNLEDAIPAEAKESARKGFIDMAKAVDFGSTGLWTRIRQNSHDSREIGFINYENIKGKAVLKFWPIRNIGLIHN
jgi:malyl-CoA/(S)-citramalyl-CoA lyase